MLSRPAATSDPATATLRDIDVRADLKIQRPGRQAVLQRFAHNYVERHRHRTNQLLHVVGVPLTFVATTICLVQHRWFWAAACFLGGYVLQFAGHAIEGNDAGELILVKKLLRRPYVEFGPLSNGRPPVKDPKSDD